ncbi:prepilin-type N-terminal cleavage/methylation domain-containing protein [Thiotrichales bacterium 19S3-7]|nr:prepilin-type N-terminal cleavage/methylation domain-containing protein [Thiotrichales bacterium 19S3-7]MCF6801231.1 prepilin-type N-terminal cleavage/methylation domain-containing protein [Thiotrichales bacterium 19S3-11]
MNIENQKGLTLVELLIALSLSFFIITAFLAFFSFSNTYEKKQASLVKQNAKLQKVTTSLMNNLRRAGYWALANDNIGKGINTNPFMQKDTDIYVNQDKTCLLYTYDIDQNGKITPMGSKPSDERFGFRLKNGYLQVRPKSLATFSCSDEMKKWINLTDKNAVKFENFQINLITENQLIQTQGFRISPKLQKRLVNIHFDAKNPQNDDMIASIDQSIFIRNDKFIAGVKDIQNIVICHKLRSKNKVTLTVNRSALNQHLSHGDSLGACQ